MIKRVYRNESEVKLQFNPGSLVILNEGDKLLFLGQEDQIERLRAVACDTSRL